MIDKVINGIAKELADYLDVIAGLDVPAINKISVTHLFGSTGEVIPSDIGITLVNIEEDRINKANDPYLKTETGITRINPEIKLNLFVLFSANFSDNYAEALKFIAYVVRFFQSKSVFTPTNSPSLDPEIKKLVVELHPMSFEQQNYLWGMVGGKYLPSVLYKIRLIVIQEEQSTEVVGRISKIKEIIK